jgi:hypothetical protein
MLELGKQALQHEATQTRTNTVLRVRGTGLLQGARGRRAHCVLLLTDF